MKHRIIATYEVIEAVNEDCVACCFFSVYKKMEEKDTDHPCGVCECDSRKVYQLKSLIIEQLEENTKENKTS
ncbi:hypothetical protein KAR91_38575 [Candidatus Pacearchaeota archaeon]|nr:hypothetical protein [Candidatus Pacearchaeota archaeon]